MKVPAVNWVPYETTTDCKYEFGKSFVHVLPVELPNIPVAQKWNKRPVFLNARFTNFAEETANFEVRSDDIWVISFPKSGTTWTQEMVRMLSTDLDYEAAANLNLDDLFVCIDTAFFYDKDELPDYVKPLNEKTTRRYVKTHLPIELLPKSIWTARPKIIYVSRNPKDTAVSFFHHYRNLQGYKGDMAAFAKAFLADEILCSPFHNHVLNYWISRDEPNILFLTYEQMKNDMMAVLKKTQTFLGKSFTDEQLEHLSRHLHVDSMKHNYNANNDIYKEHVRHLLGMEYTDPDFKFVRKGMCGSFHSELSPEEIEKFDKKTSEALKDTGFAFDM